MQAKNAAARRPTIADLAREAGVSVATVDRVLNRRYPVREATAARVLAAAEQLGYYATALLRSRLQPPEVKRTLGFLLQRGSSPFYRALAAELESVIHSVPDIRGRSVVEFADELTPTRSVERMKTLGSRVDALAVVSVDHPRVTEEIERLRAAGVPTFALLSDLSAPSRAGYVGLDARKAGRTAAWAITRLSRRPGKVAIFVGSLRYLDHDLREMSLKTYLRELAPDFRLLEPVVDLEDEAVAYGAASDLLKRNPDLVGIYLAVGELDRRFQALRETGRAGAIVFVCNELTPASRSGLIDGVIDLAIATPVPLLARRAVEAMLDAVGENRPASVLQLHVPLEVVTPESL